MTAAAWEANACCAAGMVLVLSPDHTMNRGLYCKDLSCRPPLTLPEAQALRRYMVCFPMHHPSQFIIKGKAEKQKSGHRRKKTKQVALLSQVLYTNPHASLPSQVAGGAHALCASLTL